MVKSTTPCDADRLERFRVDQLSAAEQTELDLHLDTCAVCRRSIEHASAEAQWWKEAGDFLSDDEIDLVPLATMVGGPDEAIGAPRPDIDAHIEAVLRWLSPSDDPQRLGRIGTYEISGVIGSGGMGVVLKGFDPALNRYVAIKVLSPHMAVGGAARRRFAREAQAAAAIVHENVIAIHGVAELNGLPYLVMPYERGQSLQKRIEEGGPLSIREILRIGLQAAAGLSAAHAQGLVHRDVKPANILLADGVERVTLTDFGLARAADDATITHTGFIAGTPQYMSPEQVEGRDIDHRSDLFGLGSVLYAMCTGRPPFRASTSYGLLKRVAESSPTPIQEINPDIPDWLCRIVDRLHAKPREDRFQSADELRDLLEQCLGHVQRPAAQPLPKILLRSAPATRTTKPVVLSVLVTAAGIVILLMLAWLNPHDPAQTASSDERGSGYTGGNQLSAIDASTAKDSRTSPLTAQDKAVSAGWDDQTWTALNAVAADIDQLDTMTRSIFDESKIDTKIPLNSSEGETQ